MTTIIKEMKPEPKMIMNTEHYAVQVIENEQGVIVDVFYRHGDLISTDTFWNEDTIEN